MKLLFDQNLSPVLVHRLADLYPGSVHVRDVGLARASDEEVWQYARTHGCAIVTKDSDFQEFSVLRGQPPKVVWIRRANCTTHTMADLLRENHRLLESFGADDTHALLMLF